MEAIGIFKGGFYTQRVINNKLQPYGIFGKVDIMNPRYTLKSRIADFEANDSISKIGFRNLEVSFGTEDRYMIQPSMICYADSEFVISNGQLDTPLTVRMDMDSIKLYGAPLQDCVLNEEQVYDKWGWLSSIGVGKNLHGLGLYGYFFNNSGGDKGGKKGIRHSHPSRFLNKEGRIWFGGYAFAKCQDCRKWTGKEVIQLMGDEHKYACGNCNNRVDYTIREDTLGSHMDGGYIWDAELYFHNQKGGKAERVSPDLHLKRNLKEKCGADLANSINFESST